MLASQIIAIRKENASQRLIVPTIGNVINTVNRLDSLSNVSLTALIDKYNLYCSSPTAYSRRTLILRTVTMWSDASILSLPITYSTATSKWTSRNMENGSASNASSPAGTVTFASDLNAGTETSLFGATNFANAPVIETTAGSYYTWNSTNLEFVNSGTTGSVILITLNIQLLFDTLPAGGYFTFRIRDIANSTILMTQVIQNTGSTDDTYKMLKFTTICRATTRYKFTVQYSGPALTRYAFATGSSNGSSVTFQELGGSNIA